jgi:hypothetical protein
MLGSLLMDHKLLFTILASFITYLNVSCTAKEFYKFGLSKWKTQGNDQEGKKVSKFMKRFFFFVADSETK